MSNHSKPRPRLFWLYTIVLLIVPALKAAPLTAEEFAKDPAVWTMQISPDGKTLGWIGVARGTTTLYFLDLATNKVHWLAPAGLSGSGSKKREIMDFYWVGNQRVIFLNGMRGIFTAEKDDHLPTGVGAVDCIGKNWRGLAGDNLNTEEREQQRMWGIYPPRGYVGKICEKTEDTIMFLNTSRGGEKGSSNLTPLAFRVNTRTGKYETFKDTPRLVDGWVIDHEDRLRIAIAKDGTGWTTSVLPLGDTKWQPSSDLSSSGLGLYPLAFAYEGDEIYVAKLTQAGTWGVYKYDLSKGQLGGLVIEDPNFDIINPHENPAAVRLLFSRGQHRLVGVRYMADWLKTVWFDPTFAEVQVAVDQALPQSNNLFLDWSDDHNKIVVLAQTERSLGTFYLFDRTAHSFRALGPAMPWVKPEEMAGVFPISFKARDGMSLHGYLTYPPGKPRKDLPLVVLPHGGPFLRDTMDYNPVVQFLASRGYAVLQINYRGSTGYGEKYYLAGWREVGKKIQDDIADGTKAVIAGGVADPKRVAIMGFSYGGYSALWALEHTPELYCCGISVAGVTDFNAIIGAEKQTVRLGSYDSTPWQVYASWKQKIGDPAADAESLKAISPLYHVDKIKAPVLIVQGTQDGRVPDSQARRFIAELERNNIPHESWLVKWEGHPYFSSGNQAKLYERIEAFLAKSMK